MNAAFVQTRRDDEKTASKPELLGVDDWHLKSGMEADTPKITTSATNGICCWGFFKISTWQKSSR